MARAQDRDWVDPATQEEIPADVLRTGIIHLIQLAYHYSNRNPALPHDKKALEVLRPAILEAAEHRDTLVAEQREALARWQLDLLCQLAEKAWSEPEADRTSTRDRFEGILTGLLSATQDDARRVFDLVMDRAWVTEEEGIVQAMAKAVGEEILGCSDSLLLKQRLVRPALWYTPFGTYPVQAGQAEQVATAGGRILGHEFVSGSSLHLFRYILDLVNWPATAQERDHLAAHLASQRTVASEGGGELIAYDTPIKRGDELKERQSKVPGAKASAKKRRK